MAIDTKNDDLQGLRIDRSARGEDPLPALRERLAGPWGEGARRVRFAVHLRIGTV